MEKGTRYLTNVSTCIYGVVSCVPLSNITNVFTDKSFMNNSYLNTITAEVENPLSTRIMRREHLFKLIII